MPVSLAALTSNDRAVETVPTVVRNPPKAVGTGEKISGVPLFCPTRPETATVALADWENSPGARMVKFPENGLAAGALEAIRT